MANTYTQIHIQLVFAVKYRNALINSEIKDRFYQYIIGIINNTEHKLLVINGMPDHVHILLGFRPIQSLSDFVEIVKGSSSKWLNEQKLLKYKFAWQKGFGGFSYTKSDVPKVTRYIENQEEHHKKKTFRDEYLEMLKRHEVEFDDKYIFQDLE